MIREGEYQIYGKEAWGFAAKCEIAIEDAPTVDAVQVVQCANCKWFDISEPSGTVEPIFYKCKRKSRFVESDDFCKYGEVRKE